MNINQQYMLRFNNVRFVFLLFYVLMKHYFMCVNSDAIKLSKSYSVSRGYILSHFWLAKEVNIEVKKKLQSQCL